MKTTNQNSHTHRGKKQKSCMAGTPQQLSPITVGLQLKIIIKKNKIKSSISLALSDT